MPGASAKSRSRGLRGLFDQPYLLLSLTSLFWAVNTVPGRFIVGHVPPVTLAFIRWGGAFLIVLPFALPHLARDWPVIRKHAVLMTVLALTGFSAYNTMAYYGLQYTTAINGLLLQSIGPLFVALWSFVLFRTRLTWRQAAGICISLTGVLVIICHGSLAVLVGIGFNRGDVWFLIALLIWGAVLLVPALAAEIASGQIMVFDPESVLTIIFVCIFPSLLGYQFLNRGIELIGANRAAPFMHLVPVFGSVLAIVWLGERFEIFHVVGYALVFTGITGSDEKKLGKVGWATMCGESATA